MQRLSLFVWVAVCIVPSDAFTFQSYVVGASIVEKCYDAWNKRNMKDAANCFDRSFSYDDGQYLGKITNKSELERLFHRGANALPPNSVMVVDHIAKCSRIGNIGTQ